MKSHYIIKTYINPLFTRSYWQMLRDYVGMGKNQKTQRITERDSLATFISTRASHVAQTSLYGYLRTRAGTRFPEMFEHPDILKSINIAKWQIWLACVSDLSMYAGQCMYRSGRLDDATIRQLLGAALQQLLEETGDPDEAGPDFASTRDKIVQRITTCDWQQDRDDETIFSQSPDALFYWSPIADELKERDETIVKNSIRFRWIEVRRNTLRLLDFEALAQNEPVESA